MKIKNFIFTCCVILFSSVYSQNKFIVVLDAGHGGHDPGGIGQKKTKEKEINLGLDLKGGMNVMLQVQLKDLIKAFAVNNQSPDF